MFDKVKGIAKSVFLDIPSILFGMKYIKNNNKVIKNIYLSLNNPLCPECNKSALLSKPLLTDNDEGKCIWSCANCSFYIVAEKDKNLIKRTVNQIRKESFLFNVSEDDLKNSSKKHLYASRVMYLFSILTFIGALNMIVKMVSFIIIIDWLCISLVFFIFGLKSSYRHWQAETGNVFVPGSFNKWFRNEKWII